MARIRVPLNNFERGEVSPSMTSRTDLNVYVQSAEKCRNFFLMAEGGVKRRPGTEFIHKFTTITVDNAKRLQVKIEPFLFSDDERYIVAFSAGRCDFFRIVASTGAISHIQALTADTDSTTLPWTVDTIEHQTIAQSADNMFVAHSSHIQMRIVRTGLTTFEVRKFAFDETTANDEKFQPYFAFQESGVTLTPSGTSGNITLTTSANYFESGHVGTIVRYKGNECLVTGFTSATQVNATVRKTLAGTTADTDLMNNLTLHSEVFQVLLHSMKIDFGLLAQQVNLMEYGRRKLQSFLTLMLVQHNQMRAYSLQSVLVSLTLLNI